jgi:hypothetical protein
LPDLRFGFVALSSGAPTLYHGVSDGARAIFGNVPGQVVDKMCGQKPACAATARRRGVAGTKKGLNSIQLARRTHPKKLFETCMCTHRDKRFKALKKVEKNFKKGLDRLSRAGSAACVYSPRDHRDVASNAAL